MINFGDINGITIPEGEVAKITSGSTVLWKKPASVTNFADPTSSDWWVDSRVGSDGLRRDANGYHVTNYIGPLEEGDIVKVSGMDFVNIPKQSAPYKSDKTMHNSYGNSYMVNYVGLCISDATITDKGCEFTNTKSAVKYWKFTGKLNGTVNDVIVNVKRGGVWL